MSILGGILGGRATDSFGSKKTAVICSLLMAGSILWLTQSTSLGMLYLFAIIFGLFQGGFAVPLNALLADIFGLRHFGAILGAKSFSWGIGAAFGPALAGYIFDSYGNYVAAFLTSMVAALIMAVLVLLTKRPPAKARDKTTG